jgi:hypothetical protein
MPLAMPQNAPAGAQQPAHLAIESEKKTPRRPNRCGKLLSKDFSNDADLKSFTPFASRRAARYAIH